MIKSQNNKYHTTKKKNLKTPNLDKKLKEW